MVYRGHVCGNVIVLSEGVRLPDGVEVLVEPIGHRPSVSPPTAMKMKNGIPVFEPTGIGPPPDLDLVNKIRDDEL